MAGSGGDTLSLASWRKTLRQQHDPFGARLAIPRYLQIVRRIGSAYSAKVGTGFATRIRANYF
jgi:hypothetical protein